MVHELWSRNRIDSISFRAVLKKMSFESSRASDEAGKRTEGLLLFHHLSLDFRSMEEEERKVVFCGTHGRKLFIATPQGDVLREVDLPIAGHYLAVSKSCAAVAGFEEARSSVAFVDLDRGNRDGLQDFPKCIFPISKINFPRISGKSARKFPRNTCCQEINFRFAPRSTTDQPSPTVACHLVYV